MKKYFYKSGLLAFAAVASLTSCDPEIDAPEISGGDANFTKYVAVGNSLTAGFADNGLYRSGQINSYPNILAGQFKQAGGGEFVQPLFTEAQKNGSGYITLNGFDASGNPILGRATTELALRGGQAANKDPLLTKYTDPINNLGVPGIRVSDVATAGYGSTQGNVYFERITPDNTPTQTYLDRIYKSDPTFFSCWLGNNDVLGYATAGGMAGTITPVANFLQNYNRVIDTLTHNGAKGVVATIPDVTLIPFFTTVGPTLKATLKAAGVPGMYVLTGSGSTRTIIPTANIKDGTGGKVLFPLTASAYLPLLGKSTAKYWRDLAAQQGLPKAALPVLMASFGVSIADTVKLFGFSTENPFPSSLVLDETEQTNINTATSTFNTIIKDKATQKNLGIFDVNPFFQSIQPVNGQAALVINGVNYTPAFISGNIFSLDGVHLTPRGYAIVANEYIKVINSKFNAKVPTVDVNKYPTVLFPN